MGWNMDQFDFAQGHPLMDRFKTIIYRYHPVHRREYYSTIRSSWISSCVSHYRTEKEVAMYEHTWAEPSTND